jgi:galactose mutarotase-like enzyme
MPTVTTRPSASAAAGELVVLTDERSDSRATIAPQRGALVTSFEVAGRELLFMDPSTLNDESTNVRGGVPVLFPVPGKLEHDRWQYQGKQGAMKQHGFARTLPWSLVGSSTSHGAQLTLGLASSPITRPLYPWEFAYELSFTLRDGALRLTSRVRNLGSAIMPFALGFHPYFRVDDKAQARIDTRATQVFDNTSKQVRPFIDFDFTAKELDLHLLDHGQSEAILQLSASESVTVRASLDYSVWVVWTLAERDFICLEPWTAPGNALNNGERLTTLAPGETSESWIEIAFTAG